MLFSLRLVSAACDSKYVVHLCFQDGFVFPSARPSISVVVFVGSSKVARPSSGVVADISQSDSVVFVFLSPVNVLPFLSDLNTWGKFNEIVPPLAPFRYFSFTELQNEMHRIVQALRKPGEDDEDSDSGLDMDDAKTCKICLDAVVEVRVCLSVRGGGGWAMRG